MLTLNPLTKSALRKERLFQALEGLVTLIALLLLTSVIFLEMGERRTAAERFQGSLTAFAPQPPPHEAPPAMQSAQASGRDDASERSDSSVKSVKQHTFVVDRLEEGWTVLIATGQKVPEVFHLPPDSLPAGAKEGSIVNLSVGRPAQNEETREGGAEAEAPSSSSVYVAMLKTRDSEVRLLLGSNRVTLPEDLLPSGVAEGQVMHMAITEILPTSLEPAAPDTAALSALRASLRGLERSAEAIDLTHELNPETSDSERTRRARERRGNAEAKRKVPATLSAG